MGDLTWLLSRFPIPQTVVLLVLNGVVWGFYGFWGLSEFVCLGALMVSNGAWGFRWLCCSSLIFTEAFSHPCWQGPDLSKVISCHCYCHCVIVVVVMVVAWESSPLHLVGCRCWLFARTIGPSRTLQGSLLRHAPQLQVVLLDTGWFVGIRHDLLWTAYESSLSSRW